MLKNIAMFMIALAATVSNAEASGNDLFFRMESQLAMKDRVAEIVTAYPDGALLYVTDASGKKINMVDITDPASPMSIGSISTGNGEPTSVAMDPEGRFLVATVRNGDTGENPAPGTLLVYGLANPATPELQGTLSLGVGPDSVATAREDGRLVAIVAIEDEELGDDGEIPLPGVRPGMVQLVILNEKDPAESQIVDIQFPQAMLQEIPGVNFCADAQPEFVAIHPEKNEFAVSLQENNAIAIVDFSNVQDPEVTSLFSTGVIHRRTDKRKDGRVEFKDIIKGRLEPDGIAYAKFRGRYVLATANEGDTSFKTFDNDEYSGGRGMSLFDPETGKMMWDSGIKLEEMAFLQDLYPDERSDSRGFEVGAVTTGYFYGRQLLVGAAKRGSFLAVYDLQGDEPVLLTLLPTGKRPESVLCLSNHSSGKKLIISANEGDGTINIFSVRHGEFLGE